MAAPKDLTVRNLTATENIESAGGLTAGGFLNRVDPASGISWLAGEVDPRGQFQAQPGSLYSRRVDASHGELWIQVGPAATDWQRIAP